MAGAVGWAQRARPPALAAGARVGIVAPAGPISPAGLAAGLNWLRQRGLEAVAGPDLYARQGYLAGNDRARAAALRAFLTDRRIDGLWCARGGYGCMRLLPYLTDLGRPAPKVFIGYSDITALHQALGMIGWVTFHGPMAAEAGALQDKDAAAALWRAVTSRAPLGVVQGPPEQGRPVTVCAGRAGGMLVGGNLTLLAALAGTPWALQARDCVLLLEEVSEPAYRIDRLLTQLLLSGAFSGVRGVVFGSSPTCAQQGPGQLVRLLQDRLADLGVPVLYGLLAGHIPCNLTLPLGAQVELDATAGRLSVVEAALAPA